MSGVFTLIAVTSPVQVPGQNGYSVAMHPLVASSLSWLLLPLAVFDGVKVRRNAPRLPPPGGPVRGQVGEGDPVRRILVTGDSSADGVGADHVSETLAPRIADCLFRETGEPASWRRAGANSAIASQVRDHVIPHIEERDFTHVVISVGTNDMKNFVSVPAFKKGFGGLLYAIHTRWPEARIIWSPVIAMKNIPAMPPALALILGLRTQLINDMALRLCRERHAIAAPVLPVEGPDGFAVDGFHANALGYRHWADHLARVILDEEQWQSSSPPPEQKPVSTHPSGA